MNVHSLRVTVSGAAILGAAMVAPSSFAPSASAAAVTGGTTRVEHMHSTAAKGTMPVKGHDMSAIEWLKSSKTSWTARSNAYTITAEAGGYIVRDGHGGEVATGQTLEAAKDAAQFDQDER